MQRHEREVFGFDALDLTDLAEDIYASAYAEQSIKDTNDSVRTGAATQNKEWRCNDAVFVPSRK